MTSPLPPHIPTPSLPLDLVTVRLLTALQGLCALTVGACIVIGGRDRWFAPSYREALTFPGAPASWGWFLLAAGALTLLAVVRGWRRAIAAGCYLVSVWCFFFSYTLIRAAAVDHHAGLIGAPLIISIGVACVALGTTQLLRRSIGGLDGRA